MESRLIASPVVNVNDSEDSSSVNSEGSLYTHTDADQLGDIVIDDDGTSKCHSTAFESASSGLGTFVTVRTAGSLLSGTQPKGAKEAKQASPSWFKEMLGALKLERSPLEENDWSGRGQHVEFQKHEKVPLEVGRDLGSGATSWVQMVRCRRVWLARKTMMTRREVKMESILKEVQYLQELNHPHIVRLVGTYLQGRSFSMLVYPPAEQNLQEYLESFSGMYHGENTGSLDAIEHDKDPKIYALEGFPGCLSHALRYIHANNIVHMDIKPSNILVRLVRRGINAQSGAFRTRITETLGREYRVYFCDFGLSRDFVSGLDSQTSTYQGMTPTYAAPEVAGFSNHGRAADIYSLGAVFSEIATVFVYRTVDGFARHRLSLSRGKNDSFQANPIAVLAWLKQIKSLWHTSKVFMPSGFLETIYGMLARLPSNRPSASALCSIIPSRQCCEELREAYEVDGLELPDEEVGPEPMAKVKTGEHLAPQSILEVGETQDNVPGSLQEIVPALLHGPRNPVTQERITRWMNETEFREEQRLRRPLDRHTDRILYLLRRVGPATKLR